jgi:hypothetical protein
MQHSNLQDAERAAHQPQAPLGWTLPAYDSDSKAPGIVHVVGRLVLLLPAALPLLVPC